MFVILFLEVNGKSMHNGWYLATMLKKKHFPAKYCGFEFLTTWFLQANVFYVVKWWLVSQVFIISLYKRIILSYNEFKDSGGCFNADLIAAFAIFILRMTLCIMCCELHYTSVLLFPSVAINNGWWGDLLADGSGEIRIMTGHNPCLWYNF